MNTSDKLKEKIIGRTDKKNERGGNVNVLPKIDEQREKSPSRDSEKHAKNEKYHLQIDPTINNASIAFLEGLSLPKIREIREKMMYFDDCFESERRCADFINFYKGLVDTYDIRMIAALRFNVHHVMFQKTSIRLDQACESFDKIIENLTKTEKQLLKEYVSKTIFLQTGNSSIPD